MSEVSQLVTIALSLIVHVETTNINDKAIGDNGRALGRYQIHEVAVQYVNKTYKKSYKWKEMHDPKKAREVATLYLTNCAERYRKRNGRLPTVVELCQNWNGGPYGASNPKTQPYVKKIAAVARKKQIQI